MRERTKILIYPYDVETSPILRHAKLISDYSIVALVSPNGWGFNGRDASLADGGVKINIEVNSDFEGSLPLCDTVLFSESTLPLDFHKYILPKISLSAKQGKDIIYFRKDYGENEKVIKDICGENKVTLKSYCNYDDQFAQEHRVYDARIQKINTPVIFVAGVYERTQKFEIQLSLRECFIKMGYKISQIGSRDNCELLGFYSFPKFMYSCSLSEREKICLFNHYIKNIELKEKPDIIIIGCPGGIMKVNDSFTGDFGIMACEISQAVTPDVGVLSTFYEDFMPIYFSKISTLVKYKLGFDINCYNLSNIKFDWEAANENKKESYLIVDSGFVDSKKTLFNQLQTQVFNILNSNDRDNMANHIINILSYYGEVRSV